ncbi:class I SAM-dependent methyltransferase [Actinokineospora sp.]|uniref:class I SAM-dependent methyltransferase n=1 Tax=Actinokineospora sp. TaxID=1872133 RepID=UPI004037DDB8
MLTAVGAWERYAGKAKPRRETNAAGAVTWLNWTQYPDHGPDESVLGDLSGARVLELGSGTGSNLAHVATLGARCVGVDLAPSRAVVAADTWGHVADLEFVTADAVDYLATTTTSFDVIYSVFGAVWFTDPAVLLPLVRNRMTAGGVFAFAQVPFSGEPAAGDRAIAKWNHPTSQWAQVLTDMGFHDATAEVIAPPACREQGTLLVRARNR